MKCENFVLAAEIPCEWKFATKFASECECDGVVHSVSGDFGHFESSVTGSISENVTFDVQKFYVPGLLLPLFWGSGPCPERGLSEAN